MTNLEIAHLLSEVAAAHEIKGENRFKTIAYQRAADAVEHATVELVDLYREGKLQELPGIGKTIASHLEELLRVGRVAHFEQVKAGLPEGLFALIDLPRVGAKTAFRLTQALNLESIDDLERACRTKRVAKIKTFGEKSQEAILNGIQEYRRRSKRLPLSVALEIANRVTSHLAKHASVVRVEPLGSLRRRMATIGDIDLAVASNSPSEVIAHFKALSGVKRVLAEGENRATVLLDNDHTVDLMVSQPRAFGALLQHFTGSKHHNIHLRRLANEKGLSLSEYGITRLSKGQKLTEEQILGQEIGERRSASGSLTEYTSEAMFYKRLGLDWIPPELREDQGEIEAAQKGELPVLLELTDIRGDLQLHTHWSDGVNGPAEMTEKAIALGYEYIALTDHAPSLKTQSLDHVSRVLSDRKNQIDKINYPGRRVRVLNGVEIIISADGRLALSDEILATFDWVLVSIHSSFRQPKDIMTARVLAALQNPLVDVFAHPTARLINEREGIELDWDRIFEACRQHGKILEIDGQPSRLDLPDQLAREAVHQGVNLIVDTDAHSAAMMEEMSFGVAVARRGWVEKKNVVNTLSFADFRDHYLRRRKRGW